MTFTTSILWVYLYHHTKLLIILEMHGSLSRILSDNPRKVLAARNGEHFNP